MYRCVKIQIRNSLAWFHFHIPDFNLSSLQRQPSKFSQKPRSPLRKLEAFHSLKCFDSQATRLILSSPIITDLPPPRRLHLSKSDSLSADSAFPDIYFSSDEICSE
ncbi:hypothetical protein OROMI_004049 [Orobanche minor]